MTARLYDFGVIAVSLRLDASGLAWEAFAARCNDLDRATASSPIWEATLQEIRDVLGPALSAPTKQPLEEDYLFAVVHRFSAEGTPIGRWGHEGTGPGEFSTPHSVWVLPDGRVTVADRENNRVQVFTADGSWLDDWRGNHKPMSVHGAPGGGLYVTDQVPQLSLLGPDGTILGRCRPVLNGAHGMWCGPDACIYLSEQNPPRLTRLVPVEG